MDLAPISTILAPRSDHDRATIGPGLGLDRGPRSPSIFVGSSRGDSAAEGVRSRLNRTAIVGIFHAWSAPSDDAPAGWMIAIGLIPCAAIVRRIHRWPSDGDPTVWRVPRISTMEGGRGDRGPSDENRPV